MTVKSFWDFEFKGIRRVIFSWKEKILRMNFTI